MNLHLYHIECLRYWLPADLIFNDGGKNTTCIPIHFANDHAKKELKTVQNSSDIRLSSCQCYNGDIQSILGTCW